MREPTHARPRPNPLHVLRCHPALSSAEGVHGDVALGGRHVRVQLFQVVQHRRPDARLLRRAVPSSASNDHERRTWTMHETTGRATVSPPLRAWTEDHPVAVVPWPDRRHAVTASSTTASASLTRRPWRSIRHDPRRTCWLFFHTNNASRAPLGPLRPYAYPPCPPFLRALLPFAAHMPSVPPPHPPLPPQPTYAPRRG